MERFLDTITWRFHVVFLFQLAVLLRGGGQGNLTDTLHQHLLDAVLAQSEDITEEVTTTEENLRAYTAAGSRYDKICHELGVGALFLLPNISDDV